VETQQAVMYCIMVVLTGTELVNIIQYSVMFKYRTNNSKAHSIVAVNSLPSAQRFGCSASVSGAV
jgi:hypothetical protein